MKHFLYLIVATFAIAGCEKVTVKKDAVFVISGRVGDDYNNSLVLGADASVELCLKVNYMIENGQAYSQIACSSLITNQKGEYAIKRTLALSSTVGNTIEIKSAKIYGKKYLGNSTYAYFPVSVKSIDINQQGGTVVADLAVYSVE